MYKVYGDMLSGNCYKIKLLMQFLNIEHTWVHVDILTGETETKKFEIMNPNMKIPVLIIKGTEYLWESNAILNYLALETEYLPSTNYERAKVLQWQFFEQYSHEPYIATARYINKYLGLPKEREAEYNSKQEGGYKALSVMNKQLGITKYFIGEQVTIADISLYAYTHVANEGGFNLDDYKNIKRWFKDIESIPRYIKMDRKNA